MNPKISIILPVYNAEKYLADTLDSILSQSFTDFEVVAVNDGSTDGSLKLLEVYAARDRRIKITDKENTGVSDTRNTAIRAAKGEFIAFIDADDVYAPNYLKRMCGAIEDSGADVAVCSYLTFRHHAPTFERGGHSAPKPTTISELLDTGLMTSMCVKLVRKSVITKNRIVFDTDISYSEDLFYSWKLCLSTNSMCKISDTLYGYRLTGSGATSRHHKEIFEKYKRAFDEIRSLSVKKDKMSEELNIKLSFVRGLPAFLLMISRSKCSIKNKKIQIEEILNDTVISEMLSENITCISKNKKEQRLYNNAKKRKIGRLLLHGYYLDTRSKIANLVKR